MQVQVNGELRELSEDQTVLGLVEELGFSGRRIAVEVNMEIVPRSRHQSQRLNAGDKIEIVQAIGGG